MSDSTTNISCIGIPTCDRPVLLERCVSSYLNNVFAFDRQIHLGIADDSRIPRNLATNETVIQKLENEFKLHITHLSRRVRLKQANLLSNLTGCPLSVARFALLGHDNCPLSFGSSRNALLLWAAGKQLVQVDDDTICSISQSPAYQRELIYTHEDDANNYHLFEDSTDLFQTIKTVHVDFLSLHEDLLGRKFGHIPHPSQYDFEDSSSVVATFMGTAGDSGMYGHAFRLFEQKEALADLLVSEKKFQSKMATRLVYKVAAQSSVSRGPFCMAIHMGMDARYVLPPFMPVMRNEDGVWGMILHACMPQALRGYIPYAVQHLPPNQRPPLAFEEAIRFRGLRLNDLMCQLIQFIADSSTDVLNLVTLGQQLKQFSQLPKQRFQTILLNVAQQTQDRMAIYAQACLDKQSRAPSYWIESIRTYINTSSLAALQPSLIVPIDLNGTSTERLTLFHELVGLYGELLMYWPAMMETSRLQHNQLNA